jgi:hypothetical protein
MSETAAPDVPVATVIRLGQHDGKRVELRGWAYKTRA